MLKINIQRIPADGLALDFKQEAGFFSTLKQLTEAGEVAFAEPIAFALTVQMERDIIRVDGHLSTTLRLNCSRCLETFAQCLEQDFTLRYSNRIPEDLRTGGKEEIELTGELIGLIFFQGEEIDLGEELEQQVVLNLPFKPLCRESCKGLCPWCGIDLNRKPCRCKAPDSPTPFDKLKKLKLG